MHSKNISFALRQIRRHPTYAVMAILSMALGIGAAAAFYSVLYGVLLDPYPYRDADRIAFITVKWDSQPDAGQRGFTMQQIDELKRLPPIEDVVAQTGAAMLATDGDVPVSVAVREASANQLEFLGDRPLLGRIYTAREAPEGQPPPPVAVISYLFWKSHFNGRSDVVGRTLELNRQKYTVVGVMGPRFTWSDGEVYLPLPPAQDANQRYPVLIRLRPGVSLLSASEQIDPLIQQDNRNHPKLFANGKSRTKVERLNDYLLGRFKGTLLLLFAAVALLLLIGCGNVSILMLARGTARRQELAMRAALGASRWSILQQLLTEAVVLSLTGGAFGVGLAFLGIQLIKVLMPEYSIPHEVVIAINLPVLLFSTAVSVACGIVFGISPALHFSVPEIASLIQSAGNRSTTMQRMRAQTLLIAGQIALTVVLLTSAGAAIRNYLQAFQARLGFNPQHVLTMGLRLPEHSYATWDARARYLDAVLENVQSLPGVVSASFGSGILPSENWVQAIDIAGESSNAGRRAGVQLVSPGYFASLEIPIEAGRSFTRAEILRGARVTVVSRELARRFFGRSGALGRRVSPTELAHQWPGLVQAPGTGEPLEIIGIVADVRNDGLHRPVLPQLYVPFTLTLPPYQELFVRTTGDPWQLSHAIASGLLKLDRNQTAEYVLPYPEYLSKFTWAHERFTSVLFTIFSTVALGLAAAGLFSVIAYGIEQRTREIGLRMALGAQQWNVLITLFAATLRTTAIGLVIGVTLTLLLSNIVYRWTDSSTRDPGVLLAVALIFLAAASAACFLPARRAIRIDPMQALRTE